MYTDVYYKTLFDARKDAQKFANRDEINYIIDYGSNQYYARPHFVRKAWSFYQEIETVKPLKQDNTHTLSLTAEQWQLVVDMLEIKDENYGEEQDLTEEEYDLIDKVKNLLRSI